MRALPFLVVLAALAADGARADGVALALNLPDDNPVHRAYASGIVAEAAARWRMLAPQMDPTESSNCKAEQACLLQKARLRRASHLLLVGVAGLGARDFVVSVQVFDVATSAELLAYSDVHTGGADPRGAGRALATTKLADVDGLPPAGTDAPPPLDDPPPVVDDGGPPPWMAPVGWGLIGGAAVVAGVATTLGGIDLFRRPPLIDPLFVQGFGVAAAVGAGALFVGGAGAILYDAYAARSEP